MLSRQLFANRSRISILKKTNSFSELRSFSGTATALEARKARGMPEWTYDCIKGVKDEKYLACAKDIMGIMDDPKYDDGSYGPVFIRLAWHSSGTYDVKTKTGGSNGATMRFEDGPEAKDGANAGLDIPRKLLDEKIKSKHPWISYSDLWILAANLFIENSGGPVVEFVPGRIDKPVSEAIKDHILPDGDKDEKLGEFAEINKHIRQVFGRMGLSDREACALIVGGHTYGRCHTDRSGWAGKWVTNPLKFGNIYAFRLLNDDWEIVDNKTSKCPFASRPKEGLRQYVNKKGEGDLMMLYSDMALVKDPVFKPIVEVYAKDRKALKAEFGAAWKKLTELGFKEPAKL